MEENKYEIKDGTVYVLRNTEEDTILGVFTSRELVEGLKANLIEVETHGDCEDEYEDEYEDEDEENYYDDVFEILEYTLNMADM